MIYSHRLSSTFYFYIVLIFKTDFITERYIYYMCYTRMYTKHKCAAQFGEISKQSPIPPSLTQAAEQHSAASLAPTLPAPPGGSRELDKTTGLLCPFMNFL